MSALTEAVARKTADRMAAAVREAQREDAARRTTERITGQLRALAARHARGRCGCPRCR
ncbi:hypothetical protein ABT348_24095 [Streptomyces olivaceus]|uniref:hypothetical protein n=1 Tax=Streptomyces olivaceus TaxID=47716 RepID=UPI00332649BE